MEYVGNTYSGDLASGGGVNKPDACIGMDLCGSNLGVCGIVACVSDTGVCAANTCGINEGGCIAHSCSANS